MQHITLMVQGYMGNLSEIANTSFRKVRKYVQKLAKSLAVFVLKGAAGKPENMAELVKGIMHDLVSDARFVFDKNADDIRSLGNIDTARAIVEVGKSSGKVLDRAWAGAYLAGLLHEHPLVESFDLELSTSQEYDDSNFFTAHNLSVTHLTFVNDVPSVVLEDSEGEEVEADQYADMLFDRISMQDSAEYDLYAAFSGIDADDDFVVTVSRSALKELLEKDEADGLAVGEVVFATVKEC